MEHYAGIDVSLESASVCVVDATGRIVREFEDCQRTGGADPLVRRPGYRDDADRPGGRAIIAMAVCGDAGSGLAVELLETRHVRDAFKAMPVKTDRKDARGIAQLMRLGWFRPVHCKSLPAQETRALLTARKLVQSSATTWR